MVHVIGCGGGSGFFAMPASIGPRASTFNPAGRPGLGWSQPPSLFHLRRHVRGYPAKCDHHGRDYNQFQVHARRTTQPIFGSVVLFRPNQAKATTLWNAKKVAETEPSLDGAPPHGMPRWTAAAPSTDPTRMGADREPVKREPGTTVSATYFPCCCSVFDITVW
jgi:hypothetical protein